MKVASVVKVASMMEAAVNLKVRKLKEAALSDQKSVLLNSDLAPASYDCALDSLLALHNGCSDAVMYAKDRNVQKFLKKCKPVIVVLIFLVA